MGSHSANSLAVVGALVLTSLVSVAPASPAGAATAPIASIGDVSVYEGDVGAGRSLRFAVTINQPSTEEVTVSYIVSEGTATADVDFRPLRRVTKLLRFRPNPTTGLTPTTKFINVPVFPDTVAEGDETVVVTLTDASNPYGVGDSEGIGTIVDDDSGSGLRLAVGDASVHEGDTGDKNKVKVQVTASEPAPSDVHVTASIGGGSATLGVDYEARSRTLVLKQGTVQASFVVRVLPGTSIEPAETIDVVLAGASTGVVTDALGVITILDDD